MTLRTSLLFCAALLAASCNLETTDVTPTPPKTPTTPATPTTPTTPTTPSTGDGEEDDDNEPASQAFLWKPVSDNFGKLVVILPASFANVNSITVSGSRTESSTRSAIGNGQRPHYRFSLPGASYGKNIRVSGGGRTWIVADGSKRTQQ